MHPRTNTPSPSRHCSLRDQAEIDTICPVCMTRIRLWRVPPNWSPPDWFAEEESVVTGAIWRSAPQYSPQFGIAAPVFLEGRGLAQGLTRYRQEWTYALRCVCLLP